MNKKLLGKLCVFSVVAFLALAATLQGQTTTYRFATNTSCATATPSAGTCSSADIANGITMDGRGNSYVVGSFKGTSTATYIGGVQMVSSGGSDIFLAKFNKDGNPQWAVQGKGGVGDDDARSVAVYPDGAGGVNIYVTGYFKGTVTFTSTDATTKNLTAASGGNDIDMYIVKYDDAGVARWAMDCGNTTTGNQTRAYDIAVNNNNNIGGAVSIWVVGSFTGTVSFVTGTGIASLGSQNGFLASYTDGNNAPSGADWADGMLTTGIQIAGLIQTLGVDADKNGKTYVCGYWLYGGNANFGGAFTAVGPNGWDVGWIATYSGAGTIQALVQLGPTGQGTTGTSAQGIAVDAIGNVYTTGGFTGTNTSFPNSNTLTSLAGIDGFLLAMDNSLSTIFLDRIGGATGDDYAKRVVVDNCGQRCYVVGNFKGTESFAGSSVTLTSTGGSDAYIADFDASNGTALNADRVGGSTGTYDELANDVAINSVEDVQFCGSFKSGTGTGDPAFPTNITNVAAGTEDGFVVRWDDNYWPSLENTNLAKNQGVSIVDCLDYAVGDMAGTNVTFGTLPSLTSSNSDIYFLQCDKYANYNYFLRLTSGTSDETCKDLVSSYTYHYVSGSAATTTNKTGVTFQGAPTTNDDFTNTNTTSNAIVIKTNMAGAVQWGTSIRPNTASSSATGIGVAYDGSGYVYFCGYYSGAANTVRVYNAGGSAYGYLNATTSGTNGIFVIKYSSSGAVQWARTFDGSGDDRALGISIDASSSYYYITGCCGAITFGSLAAHTLVGTTDGYVMRGDLSNANGGAPISDAFFTTASVSAQGNDIYANNLSEVYVTGVKTSTTVVYIGSYDLTNATGNNNWNFNSSGGWATGNDILLGGGGYVYVSGMVLSTSVTFGSLPALASNGAYVVGLTSWGGTATWESTIYDAAECNGLAQEDVGDLSTDHGFVNLIGGNKTGGGTKAYLHKATQEGLEFTSRYGNPIPEENNAQMDATTSTIYPNPFDNQATLKLSSSIDLAYSPVTLMIFDMAGREVKRIEGITSQETTISGEDLVNGIYFYQVSQNGNTMCIGKMINNK